MAHSKERAGFDLTRLDGRAADERAVFGLQISEAEPKRVSRPDRLERRMIRRRLRVRYVDPDFARSVASHDELRSGAPTEHELVA